MILQFLLACFLSAISPLTAPLAAHVGSPDVFFAGNAGPYKLLVTIRPPLVVPGVAQIEIRSLAADVRQIHIVPLRLVAREAQLAPVPDVARPVKEDPQYYTGALWLMASGSWKVRVDVDGDRGPASLAVPVAALSTRVLTMQKGEGMILLPLLLLLSVGIVSIAGARVREAGLEPGVVPDRSHIRRARIVMGVAAVLLVGLLWAGNRWWDSEAGWYRRYVFKPLQLQATAEHGRLELRLDDPGWLNRSIDDLLPDHNHLMHLYVIRIPEMDLVWHLHPDRTGAGTFSQALPAMPPGRYALFGDIVHANGLGETAAAEIALPAIAGQPLTGDDAAGAGPPVVKADYNRNVSPLPQVEGQVEGNAAGGFQMIWDRQSPLRSRQPYLFRFRVVDAAGKPARGMQLYMGMQGHAAFVSQERDVFAHVHPSGSAPMASLGLTQSGLTQSGLTQSGLTQPADPHAGHMTMQSGLPAEVSFPYGFPKPGRYRIYVQMKRAGQIVTGIFDAKVEN